MSGAEAYAEIQLEKSMYSGKKFSGSMQVPNCDTCQSENACPGKDQCSYYPKSHFISTEMKA